jgi:hypothetical protein
MKLLKFIYSWTCTFFILTVLSSLVGCRREYCTVVSRETRVFPGISKEVNRVGRYPIGAPIATLQREEIVKILRTVDDKVQLIFEIELRDGRQGFIFYDGDLGRFSPSVECNDFRDTETLRKQLSDN